MTSGGDAKGWVGQKIVLEVAGDGLGEGLTVISREKRDEGSVVTTSPVSGGRCSAKKEIDKRVRISGT